jgi:hypothetical protein
MMSHLLDQIPSEQRGRTTTTPAALRHSAFEDEARSWSRQWQELCNELKTKTEKEADVGSEGQAWLLAVRTKTLDFYRSASARGCGVRAYRHCFGAVKELAARPAFQSYWTRELLLVGRFCEELRLPSPAIESARRDALQRLIWEGIWGEALEQLQKPDLAQIVQLREAAQLGAEWRKTAIVFAHWHCAFAKAFWPWLETQSIDGGIIIGRTRWHSSVSSTTSTLMHNTYDLHQALAALSAGRHVHILADGFHGERGIEIPVFGRVRPFQPTFAHLALRVQRAHPITVSLDSIGTVVFRVGDSLIPQVARPIEARAAAQRIIDRYVKFLLGEWTTHPGAVNTSQIVRYLLAPRALAERGNDAARKDTRICVCLGLFSSGSTWLFNLVRQIWLQEVGEASALPGDHLRSVFADDLADLPLTAFGARRLVLKSHAPQEMLVKMMSLARCPIVIAVRDPRDAVVSLMQRFGATFAQALDQVANSAKIIVRVDETLGPKHILRYEDGFIGEPEVFDKISVLLGVTPKPEVRTKILDSLSPKAVNAMVQQLIAAGIISERRNYDPVTHWHRGHLGDGRVGKYVTSLSELEQRVVLWRTAKFCRRFGYESEDAGEASGGRVIVITDKKIWRVDSLLAESLRQSVDEIGAVLPTSVLHVAGEPAAPAKLPNGVELRSLSCEPLQLRSALEQTKALAVVIAVDDPHLADSVWGACSRAVSESKPAFQLVFEPRLGLALRNLHNRSDAAAALVAPMKRAPNLSAGRDAGMVARSHVWVITSRRPSEWDRIAYAYVKSLARDAGIEILHTICEAVSWSSPEFYEDFLNGSAYPTIYIGGPDIGWTLYKHLLALRGTPSLSLAPDCIVPLARASDGSPSLAESIRNLLTNDSRAAPSGPMVTAGDHIIVAVLAQARAGALIRC